MIKFHKTKTFLSKNGKISDSDYERLKFDIEKRNAGDILPEGGGLRTVRAGKGGCDGLADEGRIIHGKTRRYKIY